MGRGIGRAADAAAAELQVANKMAAKINNDAVADVERLLIKLLRRADGIPPPAVQRSWFSDGLDDGLRRLAQALQRGRQVGRTLELY